jgi:hypothetical protein
MRTRSARCWLCLIIGVLLGGARVSAQPAPLAGLNWVRMEGAHSCMSAAELAFEIEHRLGRSLFVAVSDAEIFVDGWVARTQDGFEVVVEVSDRDGDVLGHRALHFVGDDCKAIESAVALVIAVTIYPDSALPFAGIALDPSTAQRLDALFASEPVDPDPASFAAGMPAPGPRDAAPAAASGGPHPQPSAALGLGVGLAPAFGWGQLPAPALGVSAHVSYAPPGGFLIEAGFVYLPSQVARPEQGAGRASFTVWTGSLALCPLRPNWAVNIDVCLGMEVGQLRVAASGFAANNVRASDAILNALAGAVWRPQLAGPLFMRVALFASAPLLQRNYSYRAVDNVPTSIFRMPQAALRAELGLGFAL